MRAAVEAGEVDPQRLQNYLKLRDEVAEAADQLAQRRQGGDSGREGARRR